MFFRSGGKARCFIRRVFFKRSGLVRPFSDNRLVDYLNSMSLLEWVGSYDTPDQATLEFMSESAAMLPRIGLIVDTAAWTEQDLQRFETASAALVGIAYDVWYIAPTDLQKDLLIGSGRVPSAQIISPREDLPDLIVLVSAGALPRSHGVRLLIDRLLSEPKVELVYSDEAELAPFGGLMASWFKPAGPSPLLAAQGMLVGSMAAFNLSRVKDRTGMVHALTQGGEVLRVFVADYSASLSGSEMAHVPHITHFNTCPSLPPIALALPPLPSDLPMVSIIIPTRDGWNFLSSCLASLNTTDWPRDRFEVIVVDNGSTDPSCLNGLAQVQSAGLIRLIRDDSPFNYSRLNNKAANVALGSVLIFLNDDTEALRRDWVKQLVRYALLPGVGAVGAKLLFDDGTIQHGGVILGAARGTAHAHVGLGAADPGYHGLATITHEVAAVTGACLAVTRTAFNSVEGFNEQFPTTFNDTVLCCDLYMKGHRTVYLAEALLYHFESKTRGSEESAEKLQRYQNEFALARSLHRDLFIEDPWYSPNLSLLDPYTLARPPRRGLEWA
jgi:GT2 family glycosyltransferase